MLLKLYVQEARVFFSLSQSLSEVTRVEVEYFDAQNQPLDSMDRDECTRVRIKLVNTVCHHRAIDCSVTFESDGHGFIPRTMQ